VALKKIDKSKLVGPEKWYLREEIQVIKLIAHPHVVEMKDVYEDFKFMYIVMEYVKGGELFDYINREDGLSEHDVVLILFQILQTIQYLHFCGVVHRDLKPENILVIHEDGNLNIKITDFGLSKLLAPNEKMYEPCGTLSYVAPEVLEGSGYGKECDIWSAGVIFHAMLLTYLPF